MHSIDSLGTNFSIDLLIPFSEFLVCVGPFGGGSPVAQWVKHWPVDLVVPGSSPA